MRPTSLTPDVEVTLMAALVELTRAESAARAGVSLRTLQSWIARGKTDPRGPFGDIWRAAKLGSKRRLRERRRLAGRRRRG